MAVPSCVWQGCESRPSRRGVRFFHGCRVQGAPSQFKPAIEELAGPGPYREHLPCWVLAHHTNASSFIVNATEVVADAVGRCRPELSAAGQNGKRSSRLWLFFTELHAAERHKCRCFLWGLVSVSERESVVSENRSWFLHQQRKDICVSLVLADRNKAPRGISVHVFGAE